MEARDKNGKIINAGDNVRWCDPEENARDLKRVWTVNEIHSEECVLISDEYSQAEVMPEELEILYS
jgi:hypothetical protein